MRTRVPLEHYQDLADFVAARRYGVTREDVVDRWPELYEGAAEPSSAAERRFYRAMAAAARLRPDISRAHRATETVWILRRHLHLLPDGDLTTAELARAVRNASFRSRSGPPARGRRAA